MLTFLFLGVVSCSGPHDQCYNQLVSKPIESFSGVSSYMQETHVIVNCVLNSTIKYKKVLCKNHVSRVGEKLFQEDD